MANSMLSTQNKAKLQRAKAKKNGRAKRNEMRKEILSDVFGFFNKQKTKMTQKIDDNTINFVPQHIHEGLHDYEQEAKTVLEEVKVKNLSQRQKVGIAIIGTAVIGALALTLFSKKK